MVISGGWNIGSSSDLGANLEVTMEDVDFDNEILDGIPQSQENYTRDLIVLDRPISDDKKLIKWDVDVT